VKFPRAPGENFGGPGALREQPLESVAPGVETPGERGPFAAQGRTPGFFPTRDYEGLRETTRNALVRRSRRLPRFHGPERPASIPTPEPRRAMPSCPRRPPSHGGPAWRMLAGRRGFAFATWRRATMAVLLGRPYPFWHFGAFGAVREVGPSSRHKAPLLPGLRRRGQAVGRRPGGVTTSLQRVARRNHC